MVLAIWLRPWLGLCKKREKPMRDSLKGSLTVVIVVEPWRFDIERDGESLP